MNQNIELKQGNYALALGFIKHIFGEKELEHNGKKLYSWQLGLDYIKLLLTKPDQKLPILLLYSDNHQTGKSTFLEWLGYMTGDYLAFDNDSFTDEHTIKEGLQGSLVICDEYFGSSKRSIERVKMWATALEMGFDVKHEPTELVAVKARFAFASNTNVVKLALQHQKRFWLVEPKEVTHKQPGVFNMLKSQTPAFLHWLINGLDLCTERESRMWFSISLTSTPKEAEELPPVSNAELASPDYYETMEQDLKELRADTENQAAQIETLQQLVDELKNIIDTGVKVRVLQKEFFKLRGQKVYAKAKEVLEEVKPLEKEFDKLAKAALNA